jgi:acetylornithine/N-succinyldiaminopimelate aminotransferase
MNQPEDVTRVMFDQYMVPNYAPSSVIPVKGLGSRLWDQAGTEYIDFAGGIAVNSLGHCHPGVVNVLKKQAESLWHLSNILTNEPALRLAKLLVESTFAHKVFFANSGAEVNEAALKLCRRYAIEHFSEKKDKIIAFKQGFHGRTFFTVTVGGQASYSDGFGPKPGAVLHVPFNDLDAVRELMNDEICGIMVEPIQGEGGIVPATVDFLHGLRELCDQHKALLIFDEVQTGVGRTGKLYAYMHTGVQPDILTTAKSLGGGFPVGAMLTTDHIAATFKTGTHGSTFGGNPLACAVAEAVVQEINQPKILEGVLERERWFKEALAAINTRHGLFEEIRGQGMLLGCLLTEAYRGRAREFLQAAVQEGVMVLIAGPNVLRMTPSLIIPREDVEVGMARLERAIERVIQG